MTDEEKQAVFRYIIEQLVSQGFSSRRSDLVLFYYLDYATEIDPAKLIMIQMQNRITTLNTSIEKSQIELTDLNAALSKVSNTDPSIADI